MTALSQNCIANETVAMEVNIGIAVARMAYNVLVTSHVKRGCLDVGIGLERRARWG